MKRLLVLGLIGLAVVLLALSIQHKSSNTTEAQPTPYSAALLSSGEVVSLTSLEGKPAVLSSWASWCVECQHELPSLEQLWESRKDNGLMVVAINLDVDKSNPAVATMILGAKLSMPLWNDSDNNYSTYFSAPGVPTSVLLDSAGRVLKTWIGRTDFQSADVLSHIDSALAS